MTNPAFILRLSTAADLPAVFALLQQMAAEDATADELEATPDALRDTLFGPNPPAQILLAHAADTGEAVGYAAYFRTYSTYLAKPGLWLDDLYVVAGWRGRGVGQALLSDVARQVVEMGGGRLEWHANHVNARALAFYARNGAHILPDIHTLRVSGDALRVLANV